MSRILDALLGLSNESKAQILDALIMDKDVRDSEDDHVVLRTVDRKRSRHDTRNMIPGCIPPFLIDGKEIK